MKSRFFTNTNGWGSVDLYLVELQPDGTIYFHNKDKTFEEKTDSNKLNVSDIERFVKVGCWKEVFNHKVKETPRKVSAEKPLEQFLNDLIEVCLTDLKASNPDEPWDEDASRAQFRKEAFEEVLEFMKNKNISC